MKDVSQQQAASILSDLPYEQWLSVGRMMTPKGIHKAKMSCLRELYWFLEPSSRSLAAIRLDRVAEWADESLGDGYLADEIQRINAMDTSYVDKCHLLCELLGERIRELEAITGKREVGDA